MTAVVAATVGMGIEKSIRGLMGFSYVLIYVKLLCFPLWRLFIWLVGETGGSDDGCGGGEGVLFNGKMCAGFLTNMCFCTWAEVGAVVTTLAVIGCLIT